MGEEWQFYLEYNALLRKDQWLGYSDYTRTQYRGKVINRSVADTKLTLDYCTWDRTCPNAYDEVRPNNIPGSGEDLYFSGRRLSLEGVYDWTESRDILAELRRDTQQSTDKPYEYTQTILTGGVE